MGLQYILVKLRGKMDFANLISLFRTSWFSSSAFYKQSENFGGLSKRIISMFMFSRLCRIKLNLDDILIGYAEDIDFIGNMNNRYIFSIHIFNSTSNKVSTGRFKAATDIRIWPSGIVTLPLFDETTSF